MRLAVIDDHPLVFDAVDIAIKSIPGEHVASGFATLAAFDQDLARGGQYDLVLLDLGLPGYQETAALVEYRREFERIPVVVLSALNDRETILAALDLGAMGFIPKSSRRQVLIGAIELVASGGIYIPPEALSPTGARRDISPMQEASVSNRKDSIPSAAIFAAGLTARQRDVLALLIRGLSNKLICRQLALSPNTVKSHVSAVFRTLNVETRTQAVIAAQRAGFKIEFAALPRR